MNKKLYKLMNWPQIEALVYGEETDPFKILGAHSSGANCLFQCIFPKALNVDVVIKSGKEENHFPMEMCDEAGFFAALVPGKKPSDYFYEVQYEDEKCRIFDPYAFSDYEISREDSDKIVNGIHYELYKVLGSHPVTVKKVSGVVFRVWAPEALSVSLTGSFNRNEIISLPMKKDDRNGIFELFVPGLETGCHYRYAIRKKNGEVVLKNDPYAFSGISKSSDESEVYVSDFSFSDKEYTKKQHSSKTHNQPISIYELYLGSFKKDKGECLNYRELAPLVAKYVKDMGYTHILVMPVMEHEIDASWGYQISSFYAPTSRYGSPDDFKFFIQVMHENDIAVILDWAPNHFPQKEYGLAQFDGTYLYEHMDPRKGIHPFFGTCLFNYGRPEVSNYLIANALYWIEEYHADGLKIDSVSSMLYLDYGRIGREWVPNVYGGNENLEAIEFVKHLNSIIKKRNPGVLLIAQDESGFPGITDPLDEGGLGFDMKLNQAMVETFFDYMGYDPYFRASRHRELSVSMVYQYSADFINALSHEQFIYGKGSLLSKMPGDLSAKFANVRLSLAYMFLHPGYKLIFEGQDIANDCEFDECVEVIWNDVRKKNNKGIKKLVHDLNKLYVSNSALFEYDTEPAGFEWINDLDSIHNTLSFLRKTKKDEDTILCVFNFANAEEEITVGTPLAGKYKTLLYSDDTEYGGKSSGSIKPQNVSEIGADGRNFSLTFKMAPLSVRVLKYVPFTEHEKFQIMKRKEAEVAKTEAAKYHAEMLSFEEDYRIAMEEMENARVRMEEAKAAAQKARDNEMKEYEKAKRAIEEAK